MDLNPDLCNAGAVLHQLSDQINWELVVLQVDDKPVDDGSMRVMLMHEIHKPELMAKIVGYLHDDDS